MLIGRAVSVEVHRDDGDILTKGDKAEIGILGPLKEKVDERSKYKAYLGRIPIS